MTTLCYCHECGDIFEFSGTCPVDRVPLTHVAELPQDLISRLAKEGALTQDDLDSLEVKS